MATKVIRVGESQYKRLRAMADSHNLTMAEMLSALIDKIKSADFEIKPAEINVDVVIDEGFKKLVEQYKTVAQAERENNGKLETD